MHNPFKPQIARYDSLSFCVKRLTITGWKYLDLYNYTKWTKRPKGALGMGMFWLRFTGPKCKAELGYLMNICPPPF